ncbi:MAG TPA: methyltransferase [Ferruginibacter sp.]|nr:methyltransferase [Ferruginibacter sp.]HPH92674.1 methyltransferase [Ferruginibacter sp.]
MPNNYFKFKQFTIQQEHCAMKVCTDACLFGAYVADQVKTKSSAKILDIGTGTGLLSLMLAQRVPALIDAIEIDEAASLQANKNFEQSPWKERLTVFNTDVLQFDTDKNYDYIISNPPFFEKDLKSNDNSKNNAKHDTSLTLEQLLSVTKSLLKEDGTFAVLLPCHRVEEFISMASTNDFHLSKKILVKQTEKHDPFRGILIFSRLQAVQYEETIVIKNIEEKYSTRFSELLKDYYLYL